jgi:hypothetical protein
MGTMRLKRVTGDDALYLKTLDSTVQLYRRESQFGPRKEVSWPEALFLMEQGKVELLETIVQVGRVVARI